ncbi:MAG: hypothetical protein WC586_08780 [Methanoregula sp.]
MAEGVKQRGAKLFRISVIRTLVHQYRIRYWCRVRTCQERGKKWKRHFRFNDQETLERFGWRG